MKRRVSILDRLDLMDEAMPRQPIVEICGDGRVIVENHGGVMEYSGEVIRIRVRYGSILIGGEDLLLRKMCGQQLVITGKIGAVTLDRGE